MKLALSIILYMIINVLSLTPGENCEMCQIVLRTVYSHFAANIPSRKKLGNQLKHECKRHFHYRRRCLMAVKDQGEFLYREMTAGEFKPIKPCYILKECKRLQSPLPDDYNPPNDIIISENSTIFDDDSYPEASK